MRKPWVDAPATMRCGSCGGALLLTARKSRPVSKCIEPDCGLMFIGEYDRRLDEDCNRHPAVRALIARTTTADVNSLVESALADGLRG